MMETFICPVGSLQAQEDFAVDEIEYEDTSRQLYLGADISVQQWAITTRPLTEAEMQAARAFYRARKGSYDAFLWHHPEEGVTYSVRFVRKSWKIEDIDATRWRISFSLRTG